MRLSVGSLVGALSILASSCATTSKSEAPCFDGWTSDSSGPSIVWLPSQSEAVKLQELLADDSPVVCYHQLPSGKIIVLTKRDGVVYFTTIMPEDDGFEIVDSGIVL